MLSEVRDLKADEVQLHSIRLRHKFRCLTAVAETQIAAPSIPEWLANVYPMIAREARQAGARLTGPPFARFHQMDDGLVKVEAGFPVDRIIPTRNGVHSSLLPEADAITTTHVGPYTRMEPAYAAVGGWLAEHQCEADGDPWEIYIAEPEAEPDTGAEPDDRPEPRWWLTELVQPCRPR
jgi:effector-binding domain-containing protein